MDKIVENVSFLITVFIITHSLAFLNMFRKRIVWKRHSPFCHQPEGMALCRYAPWGRRRVQSSIRWWKRQKPTACGWMTICFICSTYCLSVRSGTRTLRLMICSLGQKKWSRGFRQCECWEPRLFCIGGLLSGYDWQPSNTEMPNLFLQFAYLVFHIKIWAFRREREKMLSKNDII